jgi:hypothetical protein
VNCWHTSLLGEVNLDVNNVFCAIPCFIPIPLITFKKLVDKCLQPCTCDE